MSPGDRVDEILKLIDETLAEAGVPAEVPAGIADQQAKASEDAFPGWVKSSPAA